MEHYTVRPAGGKQPPLRVPRADPRPRPARGGVAAAACGQHGCAGSGLRGRRRPAAGKGPTAEPPPAGCPWRAECGLPGQPHCVARGAGCSPSRDGGKARHVAGELQLRERPVVGGAVRLPARAARSQGSRPLQSQEPHSAAGVSDWLQNRRLAS